ncbi:YbbR-like domain-containing protein [Hymenobacter jeollabukensis]|uniref:YbbR-like domain-containing protein n=1 Tax=Hymenobacter jeollabukensis TaxID=2025313 RepID=A0A5R8WTW4_9BACT|nr:hypothetical protein [Hymenobacter jeollabukensis]TLM95197.1 hypothetical protein FDY95_05250 [Hymenobacter jeollabukensis]
MPLQAARSLAQWFIRPLSEPERSFWRVVTACFLAAVILWLLNALNKTYTTRIGYPLQWHYDEARFIPVRPLPTLVEVQVTGRGWKLLRNTLGLDIRPAEVIVRRPLGSGAIAGSTLRPGLVGAMESLQLNAVLTDTVYFEFDQLVTRQLPLRLSPAANGAALPYAARFEPAVVTFRGPATTLNALPNYYQVHLPKAPAGRSDGTIIVPIGGPALVETDVQQVQVKLQPRAVRTRKLLVTPTLHNVPADTALRLQPAQVAVTVEYFPEDSARLSLEQVQVFADYRQLRHQDSTVQLLFRPLPYTVRGARIGGASTAKVLPAPARDAD